MRRQPIITKDGSHTIEVPEMNVTYHSVHGAIQESQHVFIREGLHHLINQSTKQPINLLEMGFGTGLNALLTYIEAEKKQQKINYTAIEAFPLTKDEIISLNYCQQVNRLDLQPVFNKFHDCDWQEEIAISPFFTLQKINDYLINYSTNQPINLLYYDAFAPSAQPELWTTPIFEKLLFMMAPEGILVTYCSKGDVRRAMKSAGFVVEKLQGPPGKREMLRARKE